jgi:hypothetical protein
MIAAALVAAAVAWVLAEPIAKGPVLVSVSAHHGLDAGDLPALALLVLAFAIARPRRT